MKLFVHDYAGHAFPMQLSRCLARRNFEVTHAFFSGMRSPRGNIELRPDDPANLRIIPIGLDKPFEKYGLIKRALQEREYGRRLGRLIAEDAPDVVLVNAPNDVMEVLCARLSSSVKLIWWVQDIYSCAIGSLLRPKLGPLADLAAAVYRAKEYRIAARTQGIILISDDFVPFFERLGVIASKLKVIENWATVDELIPRDSDNPWRREFGLSGKCVVLYSGTLGLKHDPSLLVEIAERLRARELNEAVVLVVSEGPGADFLNEQRVRRKLSNLMVVTWQSHERLSEVLSTGDIVVALMEKEAGTYSVPSKILSALCVGRPIVAAIPSTNLAARTIIRAQAGYVLEPEQRGAFVEQILRLIERPDLRRQLGLNGCAYAMRTFDIERIADEFARVIG